MLIWRRSHGGVYSADGFSIYDTYGERRTTEWRLVDWRHDGPSTAHATLDDAKAAAERLATEAA